MNFSAMDRRVTILKYTPTTGDLGGAGDAWTDGDEVWAERRDQPGRERVASGEITASAPAIFFLRWRDDIDAKDRLRCEGVEYDISAPPREIGRRDGLEIIGTARKG
jgi:SPP1 family predicted phage head-tail adaptor